MTLRIARDLALPLDAVTSTLIVYGGKGMGKTNFGAVLAEEIDRARRRFSVIDPLGVWWGLAHSADESGRGVRFVGLGGPKGDIPITPQSGAIVADFVADESVSTVVTLLHADGRMWTVGERIRFVADFMYRLFERQGEKKVPLHLIVDEAGRFVPQQIPAGSPDIARCVGGVEQMVEWGRNVGVGVTLITQRSARMNKSVSELADAMVAFRTVGPRSIEAVIDWLGDHVPKERAKEIIEQLRSLPIGTALVISPGWLQLERVVAMRARQTFDSSKTPDGGAAAAPRGPGSKPDLDKYRDRMAATIEEAEATDPRKLQARIRELERAIASRAATPPPAPPRTVERIVEVPVLNGQVDELRSIVAELRTIGTGMVTAGTGLAGVADSITTALARVGAPRPAATVMPTREPKGTAERPARSGNLSQPTAALPPQAGTPAPRPAAELTARSSGEAGSLGKAERQILGALASYPTGLTRDQLAFASGYHTRSKGYTNALGGLRSSGLVTAGWPAELTPEGRAVAPPSAGIGDPVEYWLSKFGRAERAILTKLLEIYPAEAIREELVVDAGFEHVRTKGFTNALGRLRGLGLVEGLALSPAFARMVER